MGDSESTGRRPKYAEGDIERASKARRHPRPESAFPEVVIDPDATPLPQEPPDISQMDGFASLPPAAQRAFVSMHNVQREHDVAFARLWDARHVHTDVQELRETIAELRPQFRYLENVHSALDIHGKQLVQLVQWVTNRRDADKKLELTLESLDKRLDTIESDFREMKGTLGAFGRDIAEGFRRRDAELEEFKATVEERFDALDADRKAEHDKFEARIRSLEDSRLSMTAKAGAVAALIAILAWLVERVWK
jgi:hypothetical protein